jgi:hypothetical protein
MVTILSVSSSSSKRERISVYAIVGSADCLLDERKPAGLAKSAPGARGRAGGIDSSDLLDRAVFDERTGAEAISHGKSPFLLVAAGEDGL